jgi:hypothetical protein
MVPADAVGLKRALTPFSPFSRILLQFWRSAAHHNVGSAAEPDKQWQITSLLFKSGLFRALQITAVKYRMRALSGNASLYGCPTVN